jgi:hypothetical protein
MLSAPFKPVSGRKNFNCEGRRRLNPKSPHKLMKTSFQPIEFLSAAKCTIDPDSNAASPFDRKPAVLFTGSWLKIPKDGTPVYPTQYFPAKRRYGRKTNRLKQQNKVDAKLYELEKRLNALQTIKREPDPKDH